MQCIVLLLAIVLAHGASQADETVLLQVVRDEHRPAAAISREATEEETCSSAVQSVFRTWCDELSGFDMEFDAIDDRLQWCNIAPTEKVGPEYDTDKMCYSADVASSCQKAYDECSAKKEDAAACCVKIGSKRTGHEAPVLAAGHKTKVDSIMASASSEDASMDTSEDASNDISAVLKKRNTACNDIVQSSFRVWCDELSGFDNQFNTIDERLNWCDLEPTKKRGKEIDTDKMCYELGDAAHCREAYNSCTAVKADANKCCVKIASRRTKEDSTMLAVTSSRSD